MVVASDVGYRDFAYGTGAGSGWVDPDLSPTASKPQSKLWFAQGRWWGVLNDPVSNDFRIHVLDTSTQPWSNTGVLVDARNGSRAGRHGRRLRCVLASLLVTTQVASPTGDGRGVPAAARMVAKIACPRLRAVSVTVRSAAYAVAHASSRKPFVTLRCPPLGRRLRPLALFAGGERGLVR